MVLNCAELESDLFWKWFSRPRQTDGTTVEDYYALFYHWKEEMISLSFPAKEEDYTDGFLENLRWEIRFRLYGYMSSKSRLIDVYYAAKFEESMLVIEQTLKQIKATLDLDSNEPQMHDSNKSTVAIVELEDDSQNFVMANAVECEMELTTEKSTEPNLSGLNMFSGNFHFNSRIEEVELLHKAEMLGNEKLQQSYSFKNEVTKVVYEVFDEMSHPENGEKDQLQGAEDVGDEHIDGILVQIEEDPGKYVLSNAYDKVLYELPRPAFIETAAYMVIERGKDTHSVHYSQIAQTSTKQAFTSLDHGGAVISADNGSQLRMLDCDLIDSKGVKQYWDKMPSTSIAELRVGKSFKLILDPRGLNALNCARDELYWSDMCTHHRNNRGKSTFGECKHVLYFTGYAALFLFDPGGSYYPLRACNSTGDFKDCKEHQGHNMMRENEKYVLFSFDPGQTAHHSFSPLSVLEHEETDDSPHVKVDNQYVYNNLDDNIWLNKILMIIFDPGGCSRPHIHTSCGSFKCCNEQEDYCWVAELLIITDPLIKCQDGDIPQSMLSICLADPKKESQAKKYSITSNDVKYAGHDEISMANGKCICLVELLVDYICRTQRALDVNEVKPVQDSFSVTLDKGIISSTHAILILVHHSRDFSEISEVHSIGKFFGSSVQRHMGGCGFKILHLRLGTLGPERFELGFLLKALKHFECYLSFKGYDSMTNVKFLVFVWDPGEIVIFSYILEDKDVVERVGKDMVLMDTTLVIMGYDDEVQMRCLVMMNIVCCCHLQECMADSVIQEDQCAERDIFQRPLTLLLTLTLSCKVGERASIIHFGVVMIDPSFIMVVENFVWDPGLILVYFKFSTLRTRWLLRGRICHELTFYYIFYYVFSKLYS